MAELTNFVIKVPLPFDVQTFSLDFGAEGCIEDK